MHPRIIINFAALPPQWTLDQALARAGASGFGRIGVPRHVVDAYGWHDGLELLRGSDADISYLIHRSLFTLERPERWSDEAARVKETIDAAVSLGAPIVYATTGTGGALEWEEAVARLVDASKPVVEHADSRGVKLLLETTNPQFADIDLLHTLADTVAVARETGFGVCFDVHASWTGSHLSETVRDALPSIGLVQISDYMPGERTVFRSAPGDGIIPIERIVGWVLDGGYDGPFDLELWGIKAENPIAEFERAAVWLSELLERLGA